MDILKLNNKKIDFFGTKYTIKLVESLGDSEGKYLGVTKSGLNIIELAKTIEGKKVLDKEIYLTLLHELVHAICMTGQYNEYNDNEAFIEWTARCINSLINLNILMK